MLWASDLDVGRKASQKPGVDIGSHNHARRTHFVGQPTRNGSSPGAHLQTAPARRHTDCGEMRDGEGICPTLQRTQPVSLGLVDRVSHHVAVLTHDWPSSAADDNSPDDSGAAWRGPANPKGRSGDANRSVPW